MGIRHEVYENGQLISVTDDRVLSEEQDLIIDQFRNMCSESILKDAPISDQLNILLGNDKDPDLAKKVNACIADSRALYKDRKEQVLKTTTLDELEMLHISIMKELGAE